MAPFYKRNDQCCVPQREKKVIELVCEGPCRVLGIQNKGRIEVGYDADFALVDLNLKHTFEDSEMATQSGWTPYHGDTVTGFPIATVLAGEVVMKDGQLLARSHGAPLTFSFS